MKNIFILSLVLFLSVTLVKGQADQSLLPVTLMDQEALLQTTDNKVGDPIIPSGGSRSFTIDQNQPIGTNYMANINQTDLAQSFIPSSGLCCGAGVGLYPIAASGNFTISLWDNLPNAGGNQLASGTSFAVVESEYIWVDVTWQPVVVQPGTTYYLVFTATASFGIAGSTANPYPFGQVYANAGFTSFPNFDYTFRTFTCDGPSVPLNNRVIYFSILLMITFIAIRFRRVM